MPLTPALSHARKHRRGPRRSRAFSALAVAMAFAIVGTTLVASMANPGAAYAASGALDVVKTVEAATPLAAGDEFTYSIKVACQDEHCVNTTLTDALPDEFEGFEFVGAPQVTTASVPTTVNLSNCGDGSAVTTDCELVVSAVDPLPDSGVGLKAGDGFTVVYTLKVPQELTPTWPHNGNPITNTALATADNTPPADDRASVTVEIPVDVDVAVTKSWTPASQQYQPGVESTLTLGIRNTSNVAASSLALQDPKVAVDAQPDLPASNPFRIVDFVGFGTVTPPQGADRVSVDAYVLDGGSWSWATGTPTAAASIALPAGVSAENVAGLRLTFTDESGQAVIAAGGAAGAVEVLVKQRSTDRQGGANLVLGASASNVVTGTVRVPDEAPYSVDATAPYEIGGLTVTVNTSKTISPEDIPAGGTAVGEISARNDSNGPLQSLTITDNAGFFNSNVVFDRFAAPPTWPDGATAAEIVWYVDDDAQASVAFAEGTTPVRPGGVITGFAVTFTGTIATGATGGVVFDIATTTSLVPDADESPRRIINAASATGTNPAGTDTAHDTAPLDVYFPEIGLTLDKTVSPAGAVNIGGTAVVQLPAVTSAGSQYVRPDSIVITDLATGDPDDFWEAFNPVGIAPTQVLARSALLVEYTTDGTTWSVLHTEPVAPTARVVELPIDSPLSETITGLRFTFTDEAGFAQQTGVSPAMVFEARSHLRTSGTAVAASATEPTRYVNAAIAKATGETDGVPVESDEVGADAPSDVVTSPGTGVLYAGKQWRNVGGSDKPTIIAQSGDDAITRLSWGVPTRGFTSVTITDPSSDEASPQNTVFQAFDLTHIRPLTFAASPLLKWDSVSKVELHNGTTWVEVLPPAGNWMNASGFKGLTLTAPQSETTTGVRITLVPNDTARQNASLDPTSIDPTRPAPFSGIAVGAAGANRYFDLQWTLRNTLRVPDADKWATASTPFNSGTDGTVRNTVGISGAHPDGAASGQASDDIRLVDLSPGVDLTVGVSKPSLVIPNPGDILDADYPTIDLTFTANNTAVSRASYLRVSTPACGTAMPGCVSPASDWGANPYAGASYDPGSNPFEQVTLTGLTFTVPGTQVSKADSLVTLWLRDDGGALSTRVLSIADAEALPASELTQVVGVSVVYQGADPQNTGGSITDDVSLVMVLQTQVRKQLRSGGATDFVTAGTVNAVGVAQSYDPVLFASGALSTPNASDPGDFTLLSGVLDATASKQFTPDTVLERDRSATVQVRLHATDGASTAPTHRVTITDDDSDFWDAFTLTSLGAVTFPNGSDRVRVDVLTGGTTWIEGTPAAVAGLPAVDPADVTGIRFIFDRADGALFSTNTLPADWQATALLNVTLRDTLRSTDAAITFPASIENTVQVESARTEDPEVYAAASDAANGTVTLDTGTFGLDVAKQIAGNIHTIDPGEVAAWTLTFRNTGTGYLTISELVDELPSHVTFTGEEPGYSTTGTLSTAVELDTTTAGQLRFTWPSVGKRMSPGETFTITLATVLQPGAAPTNTNQFVVTTDQTLGTCTNQSGNGQGTLGGLASNQCGSSNFVQPRAGASIVAFKGVRGEVDGTIVSGAVNVSNPDRDCVPDADGFFVSPCAANTVIGATDEWKLRTVNSGTELVRTLTFVEPLPVAGDRMLATGAARGSTWRPILDHNFGVQVDGLPTGTTSQWEVSTDGELCVGSGASAWPTDPTCEANAWTPAGSFAGDWASVTGIRILFDFTAAPGGGLQPGQSASALFRTVNEPATAADPTLASVTVPATNQYAWNQFGVTATFPADLPMRRAPVKAGVTLSTSDLEVQKLITGPASAFAPDEFQVDVSCTVAGVPLDLGASARLTLEEGLGLEATITGIPLGSQCTTSEVGDVGEFDETQRSGDDAVTSLLSPATHQVAITNDYDWGQLSVTKTEDRAFAPLGQEVTYTVVVANEGVRTALNRVVTDTLPPGARLVSTAPTAVQNGVELSWDIAELAPGDRVSFTVVVDYSKVGTHINRATVTNPPGPWLPVRSDKPCPDDPQSACTNVTVTALTITGIVWLDWALVFAGVLTALGLLVLLMTRRIRFVR